MHRANSQYPTLSMTLRLPTCPSFQVPHSSCPLMSSWNYRYIPPYPVVFLRYSQFFLCGLPTICNHPISTPQVAEITGVNHHSWHLSPFLAFNFLFNTCHYLTMFCLTFLIHHFTFLLEYNFHRVGICI
jgi:hypothetical protein